MSVPGLAYSVADQSLQSSKSLGIFNLSARLINHLAQHAGVGNLHVLANRSWTEHLPGVDPCDIRYYDYAVAGRLARIYWDQVGVYQAARKTGQPWLLLTKGFAPLTRRRPPERMAVIMHDAMWDYYARHHPGAVSRLEHTYFRRCYLAAIRHADLLLTNSDFTRREILRIADREGLKAPATMVMGIGFDPPRAAQARDPDQPEILVLTSNQPHKRTDLAIDFMARWADASGFAGSVYWVGSLPEGTAIPRRERWVRHPRIPHGEFDALMGRAHCVLYASDYEGFGMPPVEAIMAGACPVYSDLEATREVMEDAGFSFDNDSYPAFANAMNQALTTGEDDIRAWRTQLQERHCWSAVADRVVAAMSECS